MLAREKTEEAEVEIMKKLLPKDLAMEQGGVENNVNKNKKTVVNLKFGDDNPRENCLRQLLLDLESVCSLFQGGHEQVRCEGDNEMCIHEVLKKANLFRI